MYNAANILQCTRKKLHQTQFIIRRIITHAKKNRTFSRNESVNFVVPAEFGLCWNINSYDSILNVKVTVPKSPKIKRWYVKTAIYVIFNRTTRCF